MWLLVDFDLGHPDHISIPTKQWSQIPSKLRKQIRTIEKKGEGDLQGVYQQARKYVDFGKLNPEKLMRARQTYRRVKRFTDDFTDLSRLPKPPDLATDIIHDKLTHKKIPTTVVNKWLSEKVGTNVKQPTSFIALNPDLPYKEKKKYNVLTEYIANGLEGNKRTSATGSDFVTQKEANDAYKIGKALRKRELRPDQKLLTNLAGAGATGDSKRLQVLKEISRKSTPDYEDYTYVVDELKDNLYNSDRYYRKVRGEKKLSKTLEEKKNYLRQKYNVSNK